MQFRPLTFYLGLSALLPTALVALLWTGCTLFARYRTKKIPISEETTLTNE
jgi:hypothetical protein